MDLDTLRYPIGKFQKPGVFDQQVLDRFIQQIKSFPAEVVKEVGPLTPQQQGWIYRPEGWSIKQVVHHCADSHMNAFTRFKLALTEDHPTIKPYLEDQWALHEDYAVPVVNSIKILEGVHHRWGILMKSMNEEQFSKSFYHPESEKDWTLYETAALYSWHCQHHLGHIRQAKKYQGNFQ